MSLSTVSRLLTFPGRGVCHHCAQEGAGRRCVSGTRLTLICDECLTLIEDARVPCLGRCWTCGQIADGVELHGHPLCRTCQGALRAAQVGGTDVSD